MRAAHGYVWFHLHLHNAVKSEHLGEWSPPPPSSLVQEKQGPVVFSHFKNIFTHPFPLAGIPPRPTTTVYNRGIEFPAKMLD